MTSCSVHHFFLEKALIVPRANAMFAPHTLNTNEFNKLFLIRIVVSGVQMRGDSCR